MQVKDYRDSKGQSATYRFELPASEAAVVIEAPLALADARWTVEGHPDLSRVLTIDFLFEPCTAIRSGQVYLSHVSLVEPGGPVDIETSPLPVLVERLGEVAMGRPLVGPQSPPRHDSQQLLSGHRCGIEHHGGGALDAPRGYPPGLGPTGRSRPLRGIAGRTPSAGCSIGPSICRRATWIG